MSPSVAEACKSVTRQPKRPTDARRGERQQNTSQKDFPRRTFPKCGLERLGSVARGDVRFKILTQTSNCPTDADSSS